MTAPDPAARAALLASLPAVGFVPPEGAAPWARVRSVRLPSKPRTDVPPIPAWEPGADAESVSVAVASFRTALAANEAEARREQFGRQVQLVGLRLFTIPFVVLIVLGAAVVLLVSLCGCLGFLR